MELDEAAQALADLQQASEAQLTEQQNELAQMLAAYTELARSLPGVVPGLIGGATLPEVQASLESSRLAYSEAIRAAPVSAGGGPRTVAEAPEIAYGERGFSLILQGVQQGRGGLYK